MGGVLADPAHSFPSIFEPGSGLNGWMSRWPYALPGLASALMCFVMAVLIFLGLDETHETTRHRIDWGRQTGRAIARLLCPRQKSHQYRPLEGHPTTDGVDDDETPASPRPLGLSILLMPSVLLTLTSRFLFSLHDITYNTLSLVFLPTPRASPFVHHGVHFGGGLGLTTAQVGLAMSISGFILIPLSLAVYPGVSSRLGILRSYLIFLPVALVLYAVTPFLVFVPDQALPVWFALGAVMCLKAVSRTFTCPASAIILNNFVSDPSVLALVNGLGQSITSAATSIGPLVGGWGLGLGLKYDLVGAPWWGLAVVGLTQWSILWQLNNID